MRILNIFTTVTASENKKFLDCNAKGFGKVSTIGNKIKVQVCCTTLKFYKHSMNIIIINAYVFIS